MKDNKDLQKLWFGMTSPYLSVIKIIQMHIMGLLYAA